MNHVPPGMDRLVTPDRKTSRALRAARMVENSGLVAPLAMLQPGHGRLAEGQVAVALDQARHDPLARGVYGLHVIPIFDVDLGRNCADAEDAVALNHHRVVLKRRLPRSVNQGAVADYGGVYAVAAHGSSFWKRFPSKVLLGWATCPADAC